MPGVFMSPPDRVKTTTTTTGTGAYTIATVAEPGFRRVQDTVPENMQTAFVRAMATDEGTIWQVHLGTRDGNTISVDEVLSNSDNNESPIAFPEGESVVFTDAPGSLIAFLIASNTWLADQAFRGKVILGPSDLTWLVGTKVETVHGAELHLGGVPHTLYGPGTKVQTWASDGTTYGPDLTLQRTRTNASAGSQGPRLVFEQSDGAGTSQAYATIESFWRNLTSGGNGAVNHRVRVGGSLITYLTLSAGKGTWVRNASFLVGKEADSEAIVGDVQQDGVEIATTGVTSITASNAVPLTLNRKASDGALVEFYRGATKLNGKISVTGGTVSYGAFHGVHPSQFPDGYLVPGDDVEPGTVMVTDDQPCPVASHLPCTRVSERRADPRVYGVFCGWLEDGGFDVSGLGVPPYGVLCVGEAQPGDLLVSSDVPGCAMAWRWDASPPHGSVLGKVLRASPGTDKRLVSAVIYAG
ncbi:MAG TPA: hypothetical protein VNS22_01950 [Geminicoccus sp.]|uniref:hypothetical protein n=1 Tax=Geminicoccus sp. TaxID=2024832 RepID=UPI002C86964C|nr:hypothetical protein [Geminicoccus sp.]HWL67126.1 hypothetical protein [Geminicoccus sp.]